MAQVRGVSGSGPGAGPWSEWQWPRRRSVGYLVQVSRLPGAGQSVFRGRSWTYRTVWRRSGYYLVLVSWFSGTGQISGKGPAPAESVRGRFAVQVSGMKPDLHRMLRGPAPQRWQTRSNYWGVCSCGLKRGRIRNKWCRSGYYLVQVSKFSGTGQGLGGAGR